MAERIQTEFWLSGPIENIIPSLQPVAHAILQSRREVLDVLKNFSNELIWIRPAGLASVAFHIRHLAGVADRLFTYARAEELSAVQLMELKKESAEDATENLENLMKRFNEQVDRSIEQLKHTSAESIYEIRYVGRQKIPSNVLGLLFHAAEHMQRHTGQLLVTAKIAGDGLYTPAT